MASRHRKLLDESLPEIIATFCEGNCAEPKKYNNTCPISCLSFCPDPYSCKLSIFPPPPPPLPPLVSPDSGADRRHGGLSVPLLAALAALAAAFFLFTCYTLFKFYRVWKTSRRRRRERRQPEEEEEDGGGGGDFLDEEAVDHPIWYIRTVGLPAAAISAITIVKYKGGDGVVDGSDCAVCLSEFQDDETLRLLPKCSHAFHIPCIDTWLASHTNCPMCRAGIVASAPGPAQEAPERHSGRAEEARPEVPGSGDDVEFEGDSAARARIGAEIDENDCKMRRSVSMDSVAASMISAAVASAFPRQKKAEDGGNRSSSSSMKRSASCSAKVFLSRHSSRR